MSAPDYAQSFMAERPLLPARAALVIIDMQYATAHREGPLAARMVAEGEGTTDWRFQRIHGQVIPNLQRLSGAMRVAGGRVLHVTIGAGLPDFSDAAPHMRAFFQALGNHAGAPAHRIVDELAPEPGDPVVRKTTMGAFASTGIDALLRGLGVEHLIMGGVSTNMCVDTTAREAADRGYAVTLVEDACAATHADLHEAALRSFARFFGRVRETDVVLAELG
ncbi:MAG: cysteine hydrolase [Pseudomonadota bacterium]